MSDHLPECPAPLCDAGAPNAECMGYEDCHHLCCCDALRACEQRTEEAWSAIAGRDQYAEGYAAALDAARAAVIAYADDTHQHVGMLKCWPENGDRCNITAALRVAAQRIDALREEQAPPPLPPSVGVPSKPMWPLRKEQK